MSLRKITKVIKLNFIPFAAIIINCLLYLRGEDRVSQVRSCIGTDFHLTIVGQCAV